MSKDHNDIDEYTPEIAAARKRFRRNRDFIAGEDAVKARGTEYLPERGIPSEYLPNAGNGAGATTGNGQVGSGLPYETLLKITPFFPAASHTATGFTSLAFRKPPEFEAPQGYEDVFDTVTQDCHSMEDLAREVYRETLTTNFTLLWVDHPASVTEGLNDANFLEEGFRPFIRIVKAEDVRRVEYGAVRNQRKLIRVVFDDSATRRVELRLIANVYTLTIWDHTKEGWVSTTTIPTNREKPWNEIPLVIVSSNARSLLPTQGPLDNLVLNNLHLYHAQADAHICRYFSSGPFLLAKGVKPFPLLLVPGTAIFLGGEGADPSKIDISWKEFEGVSQKFLDDHVATSKEECAAIGMRVIAPEKAAAEAAETLAIRRASENATLAALSRSISLKINEALWFFTQWLGIEDVEIQLSTDFNPVPADAGRIGQLRQMRIDGDLSYDAYVAELKALEFLSEVFNADEDRQKVLEEGLDIPRVTYPDEVEDDGE